MNVPVILSVPQQSTPDPEPPFLTRVPARVIVALRTLNDLAVKMRTTSYQTGEYSHHLLEGLELSVMEEKAQDAAARLLVDYFQGKLVPDVREALEEASARQNLTAPVERPWIPCPNCTANNPNPLCRYCDGTGNCVVIPGNRKK